MLKIKVYVVNCDANAARSITIKYFEPVHTFMSADVFHHKVELSMKQTGIIYDFNEFKDAVLHANKSQTQVLEMKSTDFFQWKDFSPKYKLQRSEPRLYLRDLIMIQAVRGNMTLRYATSFTSEFADLSFLNFKVMKDKLIQKPIPIKGPRGIEKKKKYYIIGNLGALMPENREKFWRELPTSNAVNLGTRGN